ncbi:hypothetical protein EDM80_10510 [bacterium]|nr:MAG: hypothetical protein EDM80_10510 [bacterium]RIK64068.1 MAG: hypothetical protein DCC64_04975 [Planctomycetota bacterium]
MTQFLLSFDTDYRASVLELLRATKGVRLVSAPAADGTVRIEIKAPNLDDETTLLRSVEEIPGVLDVRVQRH